MTSACFPRPKAPAAVIALLLVLLVGPAQADDFQTKLDEATRLNVTAPWRESQVILDELRQQLDQASPDQKAEFALLDARNKVLAGDLDSALNSIQDLLDRSLSRDQELRARTLGANTAILARDYELAFDYLGSALAMDSLEQSNDSSVVLLSLASYMYAQVGQPERGLDYGHRSITLASRNSNDRMQCVARQRLAFVYKIAERFEQAREQYRTALQHCQASGDETLTGVTEYSLADLLRRDGEYDAAELVFDRALPRLEKVGFKSGIAESQLYRARLDYELGDNASVTQLLNEAIDQFERDEAWDYLADAHRLLGEAAQQRSEFSQALEHFEARMVARERHMDMDRSRHLAYLEVEFDTRYKEQEIELLREQARVSLLQADAQQQRAKLRWISILFGFVLLAILVVWLIRALRERRHFHQLSQSDGLTSLYNHTHFFERLTNAVERAHRQSTPLTLVLADIDHFKLVNDRFGHLVGDEVLRHTARVLREEFSADCLIGRVGGEEFGIGLLATSQDQAIGQINALRHRLAGEARRRTDPPVTLSFGVAQLGAEQSVDTLRSRADAALYEAKNQGRNRVVAADPEAAPDVAAKADHQAVC
jgi:diguanylate cyclase (GGDEF)-like protein